MRASDEELNPFRKRYAEAVKLYHGRYFGGRGGDRQVINLTNRHVTVLTSHLAAANPEHVVSTPRREYRAQAILEGLALDHLSRELKRHKTSERLLLDGCFGPVMACRVGLRVGADIVKIDGQQFNVGQPYVRRIGLDDLIVDPSARCAEEALFIGERYRIGVDRAVESGVFRGHEDFLRMLPTLEQHPAEERQEDQGRMAGRDETFGLVKRIQLADIAVYDDGVTYILTVCADPRVGDGRILRQEEFQGPEGGPFILEHFWPVPDTPWGVPLCSIAREQAELVNEMMNKLTKQLERLKSILVASPNGKQAATDMMKEDDGGVVYTADPNSVQVRTLDAVTPALAQFSDTVTSFWNEQTGNIEILGGSDAKAGSATEYAGKQSASGVMLAKLTLSHERLENEISRQLGFYLNTDPLRQPLPLVYRMPGGEYMQVEYNPEQREYDAHDLTFKIRSLSMSSAMNDPNLKMRRLIESVMALGQAAVVSAQTGGMIDLPATARVLARQQGNEELDEMVPDPLLLQFQQQLYAGVPQPSMGRVSGPSIPGMKATNSYRIQPPGPTTSDSQTTGIGGARSALTFPMSA